MTVDKIKRAKVGIFHLVRCLLIVHSRLCRQKSYTANDLFTYTHENHACPNQSFVGISAYQQDKD